MRFALFGDHPDGLDMARALAESGRHALAVYCGPTSGAEHLQRGDLRPLRVGDLEEVLADPQIEAVIVAGGPADRSAQLRRALQSERHALCVHPLDEDPDSAYEAAMLQADTGCVLLPLLPQLLHPGILRLGETASNNEKGARPDPEHIQPGAFAPAPRALRLIEMTLWSAEAALLDAGSEGHEPGLPGWEIVRFLGGEVREVMATADAEELRAEAPLILTGVFESGGLFQVTLLSYQAEARWRLVVLNGACRSELLFPQGWPGPAQLSGVAENGAELNESWETWNPWPGMVERFEAAVLARGEGRGARDEKERSGFTVHPALGARSPSPRAQLREAITADPAHGLPHPSPLIPRPSPLAPHWQDEIRCLELDDAARRSLARRRASTLEYQEATEEAGFKGTMTLVGCSLLWISLVLLIMSVWLPWLGWLIVPVLAVFLLLQVLRWVVPGNVVGKNSDQRLEP